MSWGVECPLWGLWGDTPLVNLSAPLDTVDHCSLVLLPRSEGLREHSRSNWAPYPLRPLGLPCPLTLHYMVLGAAKRLMAVSTVPWA